MRKMVFHRPTVEGAFGELGVGETVDRGEQLAARVAVTLKQGVFVFGHGG